MRTSLALLGTLNVSGAQPAPAVAARVELSKPVRLSTLPPSERAAPATAGHIHASEDDGRVDCEVPQVPVPVSKGCLAGEPYPACRWKLPASPQRSGLFSLWRNTPDAHVSGRPGLVALLLRVAAAYSERFPGEAIVVGDLDASSLRHNTHNNGQDVDLYLPGDMLDESLPGGEVYSNYRRAAADKISASRSRVLFLAKALAQCSGGKLRIYYNDPTVVDAFHQWFRGKHYESPFGSPMVPHNDLHRFHFHVTVSETLDPGGP